MHRWLSSEGIEALEIDSSIETAQSRKRKHVKTDALDVLKLLRRQPNSAESDGKRRAHGKLSTHWRTGKRGPSATVE